MFLLSIYADRQCQAEIKDVVWEHGENLYPGWRCNYCHTQKGGGGATRLKQHLAGRGAEAGRSGLRTTNTGCFAPICTPPCHIF